MTTGGAIDCIFCAIVAGTIPATLVAENGHGIAIRDIAPVAATHVLVIPRRHVADAAALSLDDAELLAAIFALANEVAELEGIAKSGFRLVLNVGDDAGNTVNHLHFHVIGGRVMAWPPG